MENKRKIKTVVLFSFRAVTFIVFNLVAFLLPSDKSASFLIAYIFTAFAFLLQPTVAFVSVRKNRSGEESHDGLITTVMLGSIIYLALQPMIFLLFLIIPTLPYWVSLLICLSILTVVTLLVISGIEK